MVFSLSFLPGFLVVCLSLLSAYLLCDHEASRMILLVKQKTAVRSGDLFRGLGVICGWILSGVLGGSFLFVFKDCKH